ncbi:MAG TPA: hypothetical protein VNN07_02985 [Candidatus Tectomicrobia bacterium]|nr:hypothetical protein [Candidatus Tectomicrobia bacterium]
MTPRSTYRVRARLLSDPPLWSWELTDRRGAVVLSGWNANWAGYPSREEALRAGLAARKDLAKARSGERASRRTA